MVGFRVDANEQIATGHVMRCLSIAKECRKLGLEILFILAEDKETLRIKDAGFHYEVLHSDWKNLEEEIPALKKVIEKCNINYLVVDSYQATQVYLNCVNSIIPVMYIDDMALEKYDIDSVLHYSNWKEDTSYAECYRDSAVSVLCGMEYIPLREEFSQKENVGREKSIFITTGGTDTYNVAGRVVKKLLDIGCFNDYEINLVIGSMNSYKSQLKDMAQMNSRICVLENISNMSDYMRKSSFAISAGGTTLYELCACETPTICFSFADNQEGFVNQMDLHGIMISAGDARKTEDIENTIIKELIHLMENKKLQSEMVNRMRELVDGKGARRIAEYLCTRR